MILSLLLYLSHTQIQIFKNQKTCKIMCDLIILFYLFLENNKIS